jgi:hypothetical protein
MYKTVFDRQTGIMEMIELMGMRLSTYWIASLLHDLIIYYIILAFLLIVGFASHMKLIVLSWAVPVIFVLWGPS